LAKEFTGKERILQLPLRKAFMIALESIRVRFWRSMITAAGIFLGIAFLSSVLAGSAMSEIANRLSPEKLTTEVRAAAQARNMWLVVMSLIVCTVGISNSMLMSVTERFKEIGTMKCLGALDSFVRRLFLIEAAFLGIIASTIGWFVGYLGMFLLFLIRQGWAVAAGVSLRSVLMDLVTCVVVGTILTLLATVFPAQRASKLPPAAALRSEI
jgi:ABC-type antimicrobial peptide transport system permease subunit